MKISVKPSSHAHYSWEVIKTHPGTPRLRKRFKTEDAAKQYALKVRDEVAANGAQWVDLSGEERKAVLLYRDGVEGLHNPPTLYSIVSEAFARRSREFKSLTIQELADIRYAQSVEKGVSRETEVTLVGTDGTKGRLGRFCAAFKDRQAASITSEECEDWLDAQRFTATTKKDYVVTLRGLFAAGVKKRFFAENPMDSVTTPRAAAPQAKILSVEECRRWLSTISDRCRPVLAVQIFAGLRRAEVKRLRWEQINWESKTIRVTQRKGAGDKREIPRFAPLTEALESFLTPIRQSQGYIWPVGRDGLPSVQIWRREFERVCKRLEVVGWSENTFRHTFGSYRVVAIKNLEQTKLEMGHTTSQTTARFYLNSVSSNEAEAFWALRL